MKPQVAQSSIIPTDKERKVADFKGWFLGIM
jgi:hypothetical protein